MKSQLATSVFDRIDKFIVFKLRIFKAGILPRPPRARLGRSSLSPCTKESRISFAVVQAGLKLASRLKQRKRLNTSAMVTRRDRERDLRLPPPALLTNRPRASRSRARPRPPVLLAADRRPLPRRGAGASSPEELSCALGLELSRPESCSECSESDILSRFCRNGGRHKGFRNAVSRSFKRCHDVDLSNLD